MLQQPRGDAGAAQGRVIKADLGRDPGAAGRQVPPGAAAVCRDNPWHSQALRGDERLKDQAEHRATEGFSN